MPARVLAPQRGLDSIALVCMPAPLRNRFTRPFADDLHSGLPRIGKSGRGIRSLLRKNIAWSLSNGTYDRLTAVTYGDMANGLLLTACPVLFQSAH